MRVGLLLFLTLLVAIRNSKQNPVPPTIVKDGENAYTSLTYKLNTPINKLNFNGQVKLPNFSTLHSNFFSSSHSSDLLKSPLTNNLETLKSEQGGIRGEGQISKSKEIYPKKDKKMVEKVDNFHEIASVSVRFNRLEKNDKDRNSQELKTIKKFKVKFGHST